MADRVPVADPGMTFNQPVYEPVAAQYGADCVRYFYAREFPDPNQDGSPGDLADLSGATFSADLVDMYGERFEVDGEPFDLTASVSVSGTGQVRLRVTAATLAKLPAGSHRYFINMQRSGGDMVPFRAGSFSIGGPLYRDASAG